MENVTVQNQDGQNTDLTIVPATTIVTADSRSLASDLERLEKLKDVSVEGKRKANVKYWESEKGDSIRAIFMGWKQLEKTDPSTAEVTYLPAALLRAKDCDYINASIIVVESLSNVEIDSAVHILNTGKKGKMKTFEVTVIG